MQQYSDVLGVFFSEGGSINSVEDRGALDMGMWGQ
jgi:hypothetical protein